MVVSWQPLTLAEARGFVSHYTVTYSPQIISGGRKRQAAMTEVVSGMDSSAVTIDGLDPDTVYNVYVSATTGGGDGVISAIISVLKASDGSAQVGPIVGGVVAVVLILAITGVIIAVIVMRGKRTQPERQVATNLEVTENAKYYDTINEAYEAVGQGQSKTGASVSMAGVQQSQCGRKSKMEQFPLEGCPAYVSTPAGGDRGDTREENTTALYEQVTPA